MLKLLPALQAPNGIPARVLIFGFVRVFVILSLETVSHTHVSSERVCDDSVSSLPGARAENMIQLREMTQNSAVRSFKPGSFCVHAVSLCEQTLLKASRFEL